MVISGEQICNLKNEQDQTGRTINGYLRFIQSQINLQSGRKPAGAVEDSEVPYEIEDFTSEVDDFPNELLDNNNS